MSLKRGRHQTLKQNNDKQNDDKQNDKQNNDKQNNGFRCGSNSDERQVQGNDPNSYTKEKHEIG